MLYGMYLSTAGGLVESAKADVIANNLANVATPGFKQELITFTRRQSPQDALGEKFNRNPILDQIGGGVLIQKTYTDFSTRSAEQTGNPLDVFIRGKGFFAVSDGTDQYYTRAGNFTIDSEGYLATADEKYRVLDRGGSPIEARGDELTITREGTIAVRRGDVTEDVAELGVFDFSEREQGLNALSQVIERYGDNLFRYSGKEAFTTTTLVEQGAQELSGVDPTRELVAMIRANRAYEANMKMIQSQDTTLQSLINQVGRIPGQ